MRREERGKMTRAESSPRGERFDPLSFLPSNGRRHREQRALPSPRQQPRHASSLVSTAMDQTGGNGPRRSHGLRHALGAGARVVVLVPVWWCWCPCGSAGARVVVLVPVWWCWCPCGGASARVVVLVARVVVLVPVWWC
ncbi:unnamed protein product [Gadus morhua 'NCC']